MKQLTLTALFGKGEVMKAKTPDKKVSTKRPLSTSPSNSPAKKRALGADTDEPGEVGASSADHPIGTSVPLVSASTEVAATQTTGSSSAGEAGDAIPTPADGWQAFGGGWPNTGLAPLFSKLVEPAWRSLLEAEMKKDYVKEIAHFLELRRAKNATIFPPSDEIFNAFNLTPFNKIRVVLLGQDPYHNNGQAHGLCFSVPRGEKFPPSLKNIFKELSTEYPDFKMPEHGSLESWAKQGVFLLNTTLTVEAHQANSHKDIGWQTFTDSIIKLISEKTKKGVVFLLWGGFAHRKEALVDKRKHRVVKAAHPSPLSSYRFFGCKCFSKTNAQLKVLGHEPINWCNLR